MFRIASLLLALVLVGCSNVVSRISYHKQPYPTVCNSSEANTTLSMQVIAKNSTLIRISKNSVKSSSKTKSSSLAKYDEISLTKSELKEFRDVLAIYDAWAEAVSTAGVNITETRFYKTDNDAVFTVEFYSRQNANKIGFNVKLYREDHTYAYTSSSVGCLLSACAASLDHQDKMDNLSLNLP